MAKLFGTDGARGVANTELTCTIAYQLGQAAVELLGNTIVVGRDTRLSGDMLFSALSAGVMSCGGTVLDAGIIPTPAVALLTRELNASGGAVISASHNPPQYNGIKFFDAEGFKLSESLETAFEQFVQDGGADPATLPDGSGVGTIIPVEDALSRYISHAQKVVLNNGHDFAGLVVALDTGHGAASLTTRVALEGLGATVHAINEDFSGTDINVGCGSTHLEPLKELVSTTGAHIGVAHDGDADRVLFVDEAGNEIDGDMVEAVCALDLKEQGKLANNTVVSTVMCNLGFTKAMEAADIKVVQTKVGDKYVLEEMRAHGHIIGGEQSGHTILLEHNTTGDGLVTACMFLSALVRKGGSASELASVMRKYPQVLINVTVQDKDAALNDPALQQAIDAEEARLDGSGRVLVRASGTEPLIRVMVEASTEEEAQASAQAIASVVKQQ